MMGKKEELEKADTGKMTDTQSENWLSWDQVIDIYKQLDNKVNTFYKLKKITDEQYSELLSYALLSLYIHQQPRRNKDYQLMRVVDAFTTDLDTKFNYMDLSKKKFIFNVYKTSKKYGRFDLPISKQLFVSLKKYLKHRQMKLSLDDTNDKPFLIRYDGKALDKSNDITKLLNKVFGKNVGSSMLRHIFLTDKYDAIIDDQKKDASTMAHSESEQKKYVKKPITVSF
jgi:integrase